MIFMILLIHLHKFLYTFHLERKRNNPRINILLQLNRNAGLLRRCGVEIAGVWDKPVERVCSSFCILHPTSMSTTTNSIRKRTKL